MATLPQNNKRRSGGFNMIKNILRISSKIKFLEEKLKNATGKKKHHIRREISGKKATLRHLCKLYIWGI